MISLIVSYYNRINDTVRHTETNEELEALARCGLVEQ